MTINDLREFLDKEEARWTPEVEHYLGKFGEQPISLPAYEHRNGVLQFVGWSPNVTIFEDNTGLGFLMDVLDD